MPVLDDGPVILTLKDGAGKVWTVAGILSVACDEEAEQMAIAELPRPLKLLEIKLIERD